MIEESLSRQVDSLVEILEAQAADFARLLEHIEKGEAAVRSADVSLLLDICRDERVIAARLQELDRHRVNQVRRLKEAIGPELKNEPAMRTRDLCRHLPQSLKQRVEPVVEQLRGLAEETARRSSVLRAAATTLCRHLGGVIQAVNSSLANGATTYGRRGLIESPEVRHATVDIRR